MDNELPSFKAITKFFESKGITIEPSVSFDHHMNGVAERGFRTDREKASSMMFEANLSSVGQRILSILDVRTQQSLRQVPLPETVALDAFEHAIWLKNRSPTRAMKNKKTSWEFTTGIKPDLSSEHIFGSRVHVNIPPERRRKSLLNLRSWPGYFVGFESESVMRIFDPARHKVYRVSKAQVNEGNGLEDPQPGEPFSQ